MIHVGLVNIEKGEVVREYMRRHTLTKLFVFSPSRFAPPFAPTHLSNPTLECDGRAGVFVDYADIIMYRYFYKLLEEIDGQTLVVVNECLRTQNRNDLTYNCLRHCLSRTPHQLIFQHLPIIDTIEDFMILVDFDTRSMWKRERFSPEIVAHAGVKIHGAPPTLALTPIPVDEKTRATYAKEKAALVAEVRDDVDKDPHLIPRNLMLVSGKAKLPHVDPTCLYVGRNNRFKLHNMATYKDLKREDEEVGGSRARVVFELPHNFIDFADMLTITEQSTVEVLVADTKTEQWYAKRYEEWEGRVRDAAASLSSG
jgi:hypothetical protein